MINGRNNTRRADQIRGLQPFESRNYFNREIEN